MTNMNMSIFRWLYRYVFLWVFVGIEDTVAVINFKLQSRRDVDLLLEGNTTAYN